MAAGSGHVVGRYEVHGEIASGGMGVVCFARLLGSAGFQRVVALKRLHPQHARDPELVASFVDEARLAARIRHANVVATLDVVEERGELFVAMEYVHGESLARLSRAAIELGERVPRPVAAAIVCGALHGLDAAHRAVGERGEPLGLVHRDVSPENVLVGVDGVARVVDFGVALAAGRSQVTREGRLKGKLGYMAPELFDGERATPRSDVYAAGVVLWEVLAGRRLFTGDSEATVLRRVLRGDVPPPSAHAEGISLRVDAIVLQALARSPADRHASAAELARAVEEAIPVATPDEVGAWVARIGARGLAARARALADIEAGAARAAAVDAIEAPTTVMVTPSRAATAPGVGAPIGPATPAGGPGSRAAIAAALATAAASGAPGGPASAATRRRIGAIALGVPFALAAIGLVARALFVGDVVASGATTPSVVASAAVAPARAAADPDPSTGGASAAASADPPGVATAAPGSAAAASAEPPDVATAAPASAVASSDPAAPPAPTTAPRAAVAPRAPRPAAKPSAAPPAPAKPGCDPPYTVDEKGLHHYKPACL